MGSAEREPNIRALVLVDRETVEDYSLVPGLLIRKPRLIGAPGFEPGTSPTQTVRATKLRHAPTHN